MLVLYYLVVGRLPELLEELADELKPLELLLDELLSLLSPFGMLTDPLNFSTNGYKSRCGGSLPGIS